MQAYKIKNRFPFPDVVLLPFASVILGIAVGLFYYFISQFLYFHLVSPVVIAVGAAIAYQWVTGYLKVPSRIYNVICCVAIGILVVLSYHIATYYMEVKEVVAELQNKYPDATAQEARDYIEQVDQSETGFSGIVGYMLYDAKMGKTYTISSLHSGMVLNTFDFTLKGIWLELYWGLEALIIIIGCPLVTALSRRIYNAEQRDWYSSLPKRIGNVPLADKDKFLQYLQTDNIRDALALVVSPEKTQHPTIELHQYPLEHHKDGYKLLEVKQTRRKDSRNVERKVLFKTEITPVQETYFNKTLAGLSL